uniref:Uncharacterized protein n=1 Tax=Anguilla anguilla TaxID=7936 RepID=A0A0E9SS36_ANGAN
MFLQLKKKTHIIMIRVNHCSTKILVAEYNLLC